MDKEQLSDRQQREIDYHREHASRYKGSHQAIGYDLIEDPRRRWWNASWEMYTILLNQDLIGKKVLVVGCGFGEDAFRLARLGARVWAFDLSPEMLAAARETAGQEGMTIDFRLMAAEKLDYEEDFFDAVVARDILHHVEIPAALRELSRVAKDGAFFLMNEVYSHSRINSIRNSKLVTQTFYPRLAKIIYKGQRPYITEDERKLNEGDIQAIESYLTHIDRRYFYCVVNRFMTNDNVLLCKTDRMVLKTLKSLSRWFGGRVILTGKIKKHSMSDQRF
jgi:ubiquinone/menaquinone biosynthesis C-methylase UbiE